MYQNTARRPGGCMILTDPAMANAVHMDTVQCCHCDAHYAVEPGSGKTRGFCMSCMKPTCGSDACCNCEPFEKKLQDYENGKRSFL